MEKKILVIDDDIGTSIFFKICLEDAGYYVEIYNDPIKLLEDFEAGFYDLLISDIRMPKINGFELASRIKQMDKNIKICLVTAFEGYYESIIETYKELDLNCLIKKPINKPNFLEIVNKKLNPN
jgi:DNA-binding NtrC family response regulator